MSNKVFLRADAGKAIGYGHFVRSLALAAMLKDDFDCTIFTQTPSDFQKKQAEGICRLIELPSDDSRFPLFLEYLCGKETVVLDNYFFTEDYISSIRSKGCRVVRINDFFEERSSADATVFPCREPSKALLRQAFITPNATVTDASERKGRWVVAIGGTDPLGLTDRFRRELESRGMQVSTLGGGLTAEEVADMFRKSEAVLCSASSVCYEALACGCKVCAGWYVDNQKDFYGQLCERGLILPLGDLRSITVLPDGLDAAPLPSTVVTDFRKAPAYYRTLFHSLELQMVNYTDLSPDQSKAVWALRNDERIRTWMTNPEPFSFESHCKFIESLKTRTDREYYAFFLDGQLVGSYDFTDILEGASAESGLFVAPSAQGRGIARQMSCRMDSRAYFHRLKTLGVEVFTNNTKSLRYHESVGYRATGERDGMTLMTRTL